MVEKDYNATLWYVHTDMISIPQHNEEIGKRKVIIERGEVIEFRYHSDMHFRTIDDKWFCVTEEVWLKHCIKIGQIWQKVSWLNQAKTEEIWRLRLFDEVKEGIAIMDKDKASESTQVPLGEESLNNGFTKSANEE